MNNKKKSMQDTEKRGISKETQGQRKGQEEKKGRYEQEETTRTKQKSQNDVYDKNKKASNNEW